MPEASSRAHREGELANLRARLQSISGLVSDEALLKNYFPFSKLNRGIPRGSLSELSGSLGGGKTELVLAFLAENPKLKVAWIEESFSAFPMSFSFHGVALDRILFSKSPPGKLAWTASQAVKSGLFDIIVAFQNPQTRTELDSASLRRLQVSIKKTRSSLILLSDRTISNGRHFFSLQLQVFRLFGVPKTHALKENHS